MNKQAVLHIPDSQYCHPINRNTVELRLRVSAEDEFDGVTAVYGNKYVYHVTRSEVSLEKSYSDGNFDYYTITLQLKDVRLVYIFVLEQEGKKYYFSEDGITERYDFDKAYYNAFQLPYINTADIMPVVDWMRGAVFYNIFVDRFYRGNREKDDSYINMEWGEIPHPKSFAGGDIKGIMQKLDYLDGLGVTAVYLTPIFCSVSNHKYDIYDYFEIDPQFGSKQDLQELVDEAHRRGMRIVLDAVFNHCSEKLPQFADVKEKGRRSAYFDWFLIDGDKPDPAKCNYQCFGFCNYMPKFNTSNPQVQEYLREIAVYWVKNFDIDGWRLDVSDEVSHDFWRVLRKAVKAVKPDCAIIGENWHDAHPFLCGDQYDGIMNYALTKACLDYFAYGNFGAKEFADKLNALYMRNSDQANRMMMNLLDSHDTHRFYSLSNKSTDALICGLSVIFMHPGAAGVYYGTEIPLEGGYDPDCRRAMDWNAVRGNTPVKEIISRLSKIRRHEAIRYGGVRFYAKDDVFVLERSHENKTLRLNISRHGGADIRQQEKILLCYNYKEKKADGFAFVIEEVS